MNKWKEAQVWELISLGGDRFAKVSVEDALYIGQFRWYYNRGYAVRHPKMHNGVRKGKISMARLVNNTPQDMLVDHINGDTLDNRRENLRAVTYQQNSMNTKIPCNNRSGCKGVTWHSRDQVWTARIMIGGHRINLGNFSDITLAINAYETKERELFGEFRRQK